MKAGSKQYGYIEKEPSRQREQQDPEVRDGDMFDVFKDNKKANKMT